MTDDDDDRLRVSWAIPLPWLIGGCVAVIIQGATIYYAQMRQGEVTSYDY